MPKVSVYLGLYRYFRIRQFSLREEIRSPLPASCLKDCVLVKYFFISPVQNF